MTGVINVGVRLPAVIFPVVIRPSGGLAPFISLSLSLSLPSLPVCLLVLLIPCLFITLHIWLSVSSSLPFLASLLAAVSSLFHYTVYVCHTVLFSVSLIFLKPLTACCPRPLHPSLCNGNPLMDAAILVLQYGNWRDLEPHLWRGQRPFKLKLHHCCNYGGESNRMQRASSRYSGFHNGC